MKKVLLSISMLIFCSTNIHSNFEGGEFEPSKTSEPEKTSGSRARTIDEWRQGKGSTTSDTSKQIKETTTNRQKPPTFGATTKPKSIDLTKPVSETKFSADTSKEQSIEKTDQTLQKENRQQTIENKTTSNMAAALADTPPTESSSPIDSGDKESSFSDPNNRSEKDLVMDVETLLNKYVDIDFNKNQKSAWQQFVDYIKELFNMNTDRSISENQLVEDLKNAKFTDSEKEKIKKQIKTALESSENESLKNNKGRIINILDKAGF